MRVKEQSIWPPTSMDFISMLFKKIKKVAAHLNGEGPGCL